MEWTGHVGRLAVIRNLHILVQISERKERTYSIDQNKDVWKWMLRKEVRRIFIEVMWLRIKPPAMTITNLLVA